MAKAVERVPETIEDKELLREFTELVDELCYDRYDPEQFAKDWANIMAGAKAEDTPWHLGYHALVDPGEGINRLLGIEGRYYLKHPGPVATHELWLHFEYGEDLAISFKHGPSDQLDLIDELEMSDFTIPPENWIQELRRITEAVKKFQADGRLVPAESPHGI